LIANRKTFEFAYNLNIFFRYSNTRSRYEIAPPRGLIARALPLVFLTILSSFGFAFLPQCLHAQQHDSLTAIADTLVANNINGEPVEELNGHMQFRQGSLYGSADRAIQYLKTRRTELIGHVEIHQDTLSLYAPHVLYNDSTGIGHADGNVRLFDRDNELTAHEGDYDVQNQVARFHGHVTMTQGKTTSLSDDLTYYRSTETSILTGNAEIKSDSGSLVADTITHVRALDETTAKGNVLLSNDSLRLNSDWFYNSGSLGQMLARGHVSVEDVKNKTTIFGDTMARFAATKYTIVPRHPLLLYVDSSQVRDSTGKMVTTFDTMFVRADTMKVWQGDSSRFVAIDSVRMYRSNFSLIGGRLVYDQVHDIMTVFHSPRQRVWNDSTEIDADSIAMLMKEHHVNRVFAVGHAFATDPLAEFPNSGRINQLEGETMMLIVMRDTARQLYDMSSALSIYFLINNGKPDGVNRASGDTIRMDLKNKQVSRLAIISGTEGEYFPERFVGDRAAAFRLTAYERHTNLRPRREEFVMPWELPAMGTPIASPPPPTTKEETPTKPNPTTEQPQPKEHHGAERR